MPILKVEMLSGRTREQKRELAKALTAEMVRVTGNRPETIQVIFAETSSSDWATGGVMLDEQGD